MYIYIYIYMCVCVLCVCVLCVYAFMYIYAYIHIHTYTHMHIYIYIYIYIHTHLSRASHLEDYADTLERGLVSDVGDADQLLGVDHGRDLLEQRVLGGAVRHLGHHDALVRSNMNTATIRFFTLPLKNIP